MRRKVVLVFILVLVVSSLMTVSSEYTLAQTPTPTPIIAVTPSSPSNYTPIPTATPIPPNPTPTPTPPVIPKPSIPEFTVRLLFSFPEGNETTIQLTVKNQPFDRSSGYTLFYNVRTRIDNGNWSEIYYPDDGYPTENNSDYTILSYIAVNDTYFMPNACPYKPIIAPSGAKLNFQVEAMIGTWGRLAYTGGPIWPYGFTGETSGWSDIQTITIPDIPLSPSASPTSTLTLQPTSTPALTPTNSALPSTTAVPLSSPIAEFPAWIAIPIAIGATLMLLVAAAKKSRY